LKRWRNKVDEEISHKLSYIVKKGERDLDRLRKTLKVIKALWDSKISYYIIKTRDDSPTCDVDVLFLDLEDYESAIDLALSAGYRFIQEEPFKGWIGIKDGIKIELHRGVSWFGMKALDNEFIGREARKVDLMGEKFQSICEDAEFALDLVHWIMDIQPLTIDGFSRMTSRIEKKHVWTEILDQAEKYGWRKQLLFHISCLNKLYEYVYSSRLNVPIKLFDVHIRPQFPFFIPSWTKGCFLMEKILRDNSGFGIRVKMLQLGLRRYLWTRLIYV
jgi:hypothetical protein